MNWCTSRMEYTDRCFTSLNDEKKKLKKIIFHKKKYWCLTDLTYSLWLYHTNVSIGPKTQKGSWYIFDVYESRVRSVIFLKKDLNISLLCILSPIPSFSAPVKVAGILG